MLRKRIFSTSPYLSLLLPKPENGATRHMLKYNNKTLLDMEKKLLKMRKIEQDRRRLNNIPEKPDEPLSEFLQPKERHYDTFLEHSDKKKLLGVSFWFIWLIILDYTE